MDFLKKLFGGAATPAVSLPEPLATQVAHYQAKPTLPGSTLLENVRLVVLDISTTGLDPAKDHITAIAAVGVAGGVIEPGDVLAMEFSATEDSREFAQERQLASLLEFIGNAPVVAYPAPFVSAFLVPPMRQLLGVEFEPVWINQASLMPELFRDQIGKQVPVDDWLHLFGIEADGRHDALVDAFAEAKLMQVALVRLAERDVLNLEQLMALEKARQWLRA